MGPTFCNFQGGGGASPTPGSAHLVSYQIHSAFNIVKRNRIMLCSILLIRRISTKIAGRNVLTFFTREIFASSCFISSRVSVILRRKGWQLNCYLFWCSHVLIGNNVVTKHLHRFLCVFPVRERLCAQSSPLTPISFLYICLMKLPHCLEDMFFLQYLYRQPHQL